MFCVNILRKAEVSVGLTGHSHLDLKKYPDLNRVAHPLRLRVSAANPEVYAMTSRGSISLPRLFAAITTLALAWLVTPAVAQNAYITDGGDNAVVVIATASNTVVATVGVGTLPQGVAVTPDGTKVYVVNFSDGTVSVIATASNTVVATINLSVSGGITAKGVAVSPNGSKVYVATQSGSTGFVAVIDTASNTFTTIDLGSVPVGSVPAAVAVSPDSSTVYVTIAPAGVVVIDAATNAVIGTINVGNDPVGVAVTPDGSKVYVANGGGGTAAEPASVSVIATASNAVVATVTPVGATAVGVAVTPDGTKVYVASVNSVFVSVIATASNTVVATVFVPGRNAMPSALGTFILPRFAGTIGSKKCDSVSSQALQKTFGNLGAAAAAIGYPTISDLRTAIAAYCGLSS